MTQPIRLSGNLSVAGVVMITASNVTPASSIFVIAPLAIASAGSGALLSFILAAVIATCVAFCYAELGAAYPSAGGEYVIAREVFGPLWGVQTYLYALGSSLFIPAVLAVGAIPYLNSALGTHLPATTTGAVTVLVGGICALLNIRANALITGVFLLLEILVLLIVGWLGFTHPHQSPAIFIHPQMPDASGSLIAVTLPVIVAMVGTALFAYNGYGSAISMAEDMAEQGRPMVRAVMYTLLLVVVVELIPFAALMLGAPSLAALTAQADPISYVLSELGGPGLSRLSAGVIYLAVFNAIIATVTQFSRVIFSSGRDGFWLPGINRALSAISARNGTPWVATVFFSLISALLAFDSRLEELTSFTVLLLLLIYLVLAVAVLFSRRRPVHHPWRMPLWPLPALVVIAACFYVLGSLLAETSWRDYLVVGGLIVVGFALNRWHRRQSAPL